MERLKFLGVESPCTIVQRSPTCRRWIQFPEPSIHRVSFLMHPQFIEFGFHQIIHFIELNGRKTEISYDSSFHRSDNQDRRLRIRKICLPKIPINARSHSPNYNGRFASCIFAPKYLLIPAPVLVAVEDHKVPGIGFTSIHVGTSLLQSGSYRPINTAVQQFALDDSLVHFPVH